VECSHTAVSLCAMCGCVRVCRVHMCMWCACVHVCVCVQQDTSNSSISFHNTHTFKYCMYTHISLPRVHTHIQTSYTHHSYCSLLPWLGGRDQAYIIDTTGTTFIHTTHTHRTTFLKLLVFHLEPQWCCSGS